MSTRVTELFNIKYPIIMAAMNFVTEPKLVAAVSEAGGLGLLAASHYSADDLRQDIRKIRELTDKPFGVNQVLERPGSRENIDICIEEKVPVVNYALGKPDWLIPRVHAYGGKVIGTTAIARHALAAEKMGVDAVTITGHEAAGHGVMETSMVLIPRVTSQVKVPVIAAGGIFDGRGVAAALALGADAVSLGTRFALTQESALHERFKQIALKATERDTLYSTHFDGIYCRVLRTPHADAVNKRWFRPIEFMSSTRKVQKMLGLPFGKFWNTAMAMKKRERLSYLQLALLGAAAIRWQTSCIHGDERRGLLPIGQSVGGCNDLPTVAELMARIVKEMEMATDRLNKLNAAGIRP